MNHPRIPASTYRLQLNAGMTFRDARSVLEYLDELGISDLYVSPISKARRGSMHGYDVIDPQQLNPEIGSADDLELVATELRERNMGLIVDIVPNHMAASLENDWWLDMLARGPASPAARYFDVDWSREGTRGGSRDKLLFPVLGRPYGDVLAKHEIRLVVDEEHGFSIRYYDHLFPVSAASLRLIAQWLRDAIEDQVASRDLALLAGEDNPREIAERLLAIARPRTRTRRILENLVSRINDGSRTTPRFFELDRLLELQHYRLAFWRMASEELNYRRFFDISELAGVTMESRETFEAVHKLPLELARRGIVTGLRIDHIDGLRDPIGYLEQLQDALPGERFYVVIEKILGPDEPVREDFACSGTTGYEFLNTINRVFVDGTGLRQIDTAYRELTDRHFPFSNVVYRTKRLAIKRLFAGELIRLTARTSTLAANDRVGRDIPFSDLRRAIIEISTALPVYRTYIRSGQIDPRDRALIEKAATDAHATSPPGLRPAIDFVARSFLLDLSAESEPYREQWLDVIMRWQQFTGPAMAKGFEDTALYRSNLLVSLNDVGSEPAPEPHRLGADAFHRESNRRLARMPATMNASSTHDTKRSEDVRARINVLSEIPVRWIRNVQQWRRINAPHRVAAGERSVPGTNEEWLLYQTLLGSWPIDRDDMESYPDRIAAYVIKAAREAKMHTSWLEPDERWEKALVSFARRLASGEGDPAFQRAFARLQKDVAFWGAVNSLSQLVLKSTAPGIPDFYQGTELWDLSLVDPDNRRRVDYDRRRRILESIRARQGEFGREQLCRDLLRQWKDGGVKLFTTSALLHLRRGQRELFDSGGYRPLAADGVLGQHLVAFAREQGSQRVVVVVPRLPASLVRPGVWPIGSEIWGDLMLRTGARSSLTNIFTGERIRVSRGTISVADALQSFPVAVLVT
ncbi:MAG: malto-oligosyltrehalose synthase [Thermoanaerobaculia bacterium]